MEKILSSIKQMLNVEQSITAFDSELIMFINSSLAELVQGGVGPLEGITIDGDTTWDAFTSDQGLVNHSKMYVFCKTRLLWDPPTNSFICEGFNKQANEAYWRAYILAQELGRETASND